MKYEVLSILRDDYNTAWRVFQKSLDIKLSNGWIPQGGISTTHAVDKDYDNIYTISLLMTKPNKDSNEIT